jgi:uncharacterized protein YprB with RNaseH-like and TPR domain
VLDRTFVHIPGIGAETERALWAQGCHTWHDFLRDPKAFSIGTACREQAEEILSQSVVALERGEFQFFRKPLGRKDAWRAFPHFRDATVYLDIETEGRPGADAVTTVGLYDGRNFTCLVRDDNLENFRDLISHYALIVTFCGTAFDLPILARRFPGLIFDQIHLDLAPTLRRIGLRGGLKRIEREVGIERGPQTAGLTGYDAVKLWRRYEREGDASALETLIAYNRDDVVNMERLAEIAYQGLVRVVTRPVEDQLTLLEAAN